MIIYRLTDRVPVKLGELTFWIAPLSADQKARIANFSKMEAGVETENGLKKATEILRMGLREVDGLTCADGSPYLLELDGKGEVTEECADELLQLDGADKVLRAIAVFGYHGRTDLSELEGVTVDFSAVKNVKKK